MKVYKRELEAGLAKVMENNTVAYTVAVNKSDTELDKAVLENILVKAGKSEKKKKWVFSEEIFYPTKSILVTTTWNKNDDVFGAQSTWNARYTPVHTFTNVDHDHDQIVGHITETWAMDAEGNIIEDDVEATDLPEKFHICNSAVIYKFPASASETAKKRAEDLIKSIEAGEMFVSMECIFSDFDYAVITPENKQYVVARNEETSFLTKHLRVYGGEGTYSGYKIGRFLKDMVFSGKGYVAKPANPESIIFAHETNTDFSSTCLYDKWLEAKAEDLNTEVNPEIIKMDNDTIAMQKKNDELQALVVSLQAELSKANVATLQARIEELSTEVSEAQAENKTLTEKVVAAEKQVTEVTAKVTEVTKANEELSEKVAKAEADSARANRVSTLVEAGLEKETAETQVDKFAGLSDEQFAVVAEALAIAEKAKFPPADDKKEEKKETKADDITDVLKDAKAEEGDGVGSVADDKSDDEDVNTRRLSISQIVFAEENEETQK